MLSDDTEAAPSTGSDSLGARREVEFAEALDRYMASYVAEKRRRLQRRAKGNLLRRLIASSLTRTAGERPRVPRWLEPILTR
jgi:hypothetical protein